VVVVEAVHLRESSQPFTLAKLLYWALLDMPVAATLLE
jgi:hypothetical protein